MDINLTVANICTVIGECGVLAGVLIPVVASIKKIKEGVKCQLRSNLLAIYYRHKDTKSIPQFEYENFMALYDAYTALKGNKFVHKLRKDIEGWEISSEDDDE